MKLILFAGCDSNTVFCQIILFCNWLILLNKNGMAGFDLCPPWQRRQSKGRIRPLNHAAPFVDVLPEVKIWVINIYRSFILPEMISPEEFFMPQLGVIKNALTCNYHVTGDFSLDAKMALRLNYYHRILLNHLLT